MKSFTKRDKQNKQEFRQVEKAIKDSYTEIKRAFQKKDSSRTTGQKQSTPCLQYYF